MHFFLESAAAALLRYDLGSLVSSALSMGAANFVGERQVQLQQRKVELTADEVNIHSVYPADMCMCVRIRCLYNL
jgi:hypothetical protein